MKKILVAICALVLSTVVFADDFKVGIVDVRQVLQRSPQVAAMQKKLQQEFGARDKQMQAAQQQLQADADNLNKNGSVMAAKDRDVLVKKMQSEQQNLQAMRISFQKDLYAKQNEEMQSILNQLQDVIAKIAKEKNLNLVVTKDAIAYANDSMDITNDVISAIK